MLNDVNVKYVAFMYYNTKKPWWCAEVLQEKTEAAAYCLKKLKNITLNPYSDNEIGHHSMRQWLQTKDLAIASINFSKVQRLGYLWESAQSQAMK